MLDFNDILQRFRQAKCLQSLNAELASAIQSFGIDMYSFTYYAYHPNSAHKLKYHFASPLYKRWHEHYIEEGYEDIDSTLDFSYQQCLPVFWDLPTQLQNATTERERCMRQDSIDYGVECGLSIPIHGPNEDFAMFLVTQTTKQNCLANWQTLQYELFIIAYCYYQALQQHLLPIPADSAYDLSARELQCLALLATRKTVKEIALKLTITERTVNFHIQNINKKLGVSNKHQAVNKALEKRLVIL